MKEFESHLKHEESRITPTIEIDDTIRVKAIDRCGMTCNFCHNEGTPVVNQTGFQQHRVSIYARDNGIPFTVADIDGREKDAFADGLRTLYDNGVASEVHWTGGEPTLAKQLPELTAAAVEIGYQVKMTSNGQSGARGLESLADAGLGGVNFSIFGTTPEELARTQAHIFSNNLRLAKLRLDKMNEAMQEAVGLNMSVKANVVISGEADIDRGLRLLDQAPESVKVRFQADTSRRQESLTAIYRLLHGLGALPVARTIVAGSSIDNIDYTLPEGRIVTFKQTQPSRLSPACDNCVVDARGDCHEGYYGLRLYKAEQDQAYWVGVCLQRMDLSQPLDFFASKKGLAKAVKMFRKSEYLKLSKEFSL
ncbi:MAG: radical SAM protein [Candidatus Saccharimonadales bacterium]